MDCRPSKDCMPGWGKCAPLMDESVLSCEKEGGGGYECETACTMEAAMARRETVQGRGN